VTGGVERQHSVALGLAATAPGCDVVVIHDAARPLVDAGLFDRCVDSARTSGAAIAATPVVDTIKRVQAGRIVNTVPRDDLWAAQTPQAFLRDRLMAAFETSIAEERIFTDEAGLFEALGWEVIVVPGSYSNFKITRPGDLAMAEALMTMGPGTTTQSGVSRTNLSGLGR
jgi:2-C-methyl-D-erythritol 4-phosphate cytidylyltransferase